MRNPLRHHNKKHKDRQLLGETFETCFVCARDRAVCRSKIRFTTWEEVDEWVREFNESTGFRPPMTRYECRWCEQWHMRTARDARSRARVERQRRKWAAVQHLLPRRRMYARLAGAFHALEERRAAEVRLAAAVPDRPRWEYVRMLQG